MTSKQQLVFYYKKTGVEKTAIKTWGGWITQCGKYLWWKRPGERKSMMGKTGGKQTDRKKPGGKRSNTAQWYLYSVFQEVPACLLRECWCCNFFFCQFTPSSRELALIYEMSRLTQGLHYIISSSSHISFESLPLLFYLFITPKVISPLCF